MGGAGKNFPPRGKSKILPNILAADIFFWKIRGGARQKETNRWKNGSAAKVK